MKTEYRNHWPRTQADAGLPDGPIDDGDDHSLDWADWFALGFGIGVLLGPAIVDFIQ